jgi:hypothetical protein
MDEPLPIEPLHLTQHTAYTVTRWPERTSFTDDWLKMAHVYGATVDGDTVTFDLFNGTSTYRLQRAEQVGAAIPADLIEGKITRRKVKG